MTISTNGKLNANTQNSIHFLISFGEDFHTTVLKIAIPMLLLATLCACILHWVGVI
jgi:hypothetical protein